MVLVGLSSFLFGICFLIRGRNRGVRAIYNLYSSPKRLRSSFSSMGTIIRATIMKSIRATKPVAMVPVERKIPIKNSEWDRYVGCLTRENGPPVTSVAVSPFMTSGTPVMTLAESDFNTHNWRMMPAKASRVPKTLIITEKSIRNPRRNVLFI